MIDKLNILLLCTGENRYHDHQKIGLFLKDLLIRSGFTVSLTNDVHTLVHDTLRLYDAVVTYTVAATAPPEIVGNLLEAVSGVRPNAKGNPVGFAGIHGATTSFQDSDAYKEMIGATFITHPDFGPVYDFVIRDTAHPITQGATDFILQDELYFFETDNRFTTLVSCFHENIDRPVVWCKPYGRGRVFYIALGHGVEQMGNTHVERLFINGIRWAAAAGQAGDERRTE